MSPSEIPSVDVVVEGQDRIRFYGKGASAGMMMSSSMGPMGIAIGVAIDEGIGKEIHEAFVEAGGDFSEIVQRETEAWLAHLCNQNVIELETVCSTSNPLIVRVHRYGFVSATGDNDPIKPELEFGFTWDGKDEVRINLKDGFNRCPCLT